jgi:hypothetical protein
MHRNVEVAAAARARGLAIEPRSFPDGTKTAADAAAAIGVEVGQIVKSLVFPVDGRPTMALLSGDSRPDDKKLAAAGTWTDLFSVSPADLVGVTGRRRRWRSSTAPSGSSPAAQSTSSTPPSCASTGSPEVAALLREALRDPSCRSGWRRVDGSRRSSNGGSVRGGAARLVGLCSRGAAAGAQVRATWRDVVMRPWRDVAWAR